MNKCKNCGHGVKSHGKEKDYMKGSCRYWNICGCEKFEGEAIYDYVKRNMNQDHSPARNTVSDKEPEAAPLLNGSETSGSFNLSDKIVEFDMVRDAEYIWIKAKDVKEFIRRLKEDIKRMSNFDKLKILKEIDKLPGSKLSK